MIGKLTGFVDSQTADAVILDVNGVGYLVQCSTRTLARLRPGPDRVSLAIETQMREDGIKLFGFTADVERDWFRLLQGVQGVGSKVALAILGILTADELSLAIGRGDKAAVSRAPGVGPKLAARIVAEMKDKAPSGLSQAGHDPATDLPPAMPPNAGDALAALVNLGYGRPQAAGVLQKAVAELGPDASPSSLIRLSLKLLSA